MSWNEYCASSNRSFLRIEWRYRLKSLLGNSYLVGDAIPLLLSVIVGLVTGLGAYIFITFLSGIIYVVGQLRDQWGIIPEILIMITAGLVTGIIISRFAQEAKGHGVPEVMEAIALKRGRIRPRVAIAKIIASAITIGSGGSAGREGPIVQVGSTLGSTIGQWAHLSDEQISMLVASGAAAGIAATFNAPIAGFLFALEVILGRFSNRYLGIVVVAAVAANVVSRMLLGEKVAFEIPIYSLNSPIELLFYALLAILCAFAAILFIRVLYAAEHVFARWSVPLAIKAAFGMGLTGVVAAFAPEVMGSGLEFIGRSIAADMSFATNTMLLLFIFKLIATTFTLGAGNSGGVFAPALFMGAMMGGIIGQIGQQILPAIVVDPGAFALVGMAALFSGAARAPITAIVIILEMSNDYRLILPLLMTVILSTLIADLFHPDSIYTRKLTLRGIRLERGQDVDLLQVVKVAEVMKRDYVTVFPDTTLQELIRHFTLTHYHGFPIVDDASRLYGIVALSDLERATEENVPGDRTVMDIGRTSNLVTGFPDDPIYVALRRMNIYHIGRLPVVARDDPGKYIGMIRRADILQAYEIGLARKSIEQHQHRQFQLRKIEENEFLEIIVEPGAPMIGITLIEFPCSDKCQIVSVRRDGEIIIPHGETHICAGDLVTAYAYPEMCDIVLAQFTNSPKQ